MDSFFYGNQVINITNGQIINVNTSGSIAYITISYTQCINCIRNTQTVVLVVGSAARVYDADGTQIPVSFLRTGMFVNASFSSVMTRSNPPQATAYSIRVLRRYSENISQPMGFYSSGTIIEIDNSSRTFAIVEHNNPNSGIRFIVTPTTRFYDRFGRPVSYEALRLQMRVTVWHSQQMTTGIPAEAVAYDVQIV